MRQAVRRRDRTMVGSDLVVLAPVQSADWKLTTLMAEPSLVQFTSAEPPLDVCRHEFCANLPVWTHMRKCV